MGYGGELRASNINLGKWCLQHIRDFPKYAHSRINVLLLKGEFGNNKRSVRRYQIERKIDPTEVFS